jgi:hypothetical protein
MSTNVVYVSYGLLLGGLILVAVGILRRLGKGRAWYLVVDYPVLLPRGRSYALPVIGLIGVSFGIAILIDSPEVAQKILYWVIVPLLVISFLIIGLEPKWFKPKWVRWLEENHGDILQTLIKEGQETPNWRKRVSTQEGLEEWVEEVRRKRGLQRRTPKNQ